ncbi:MAG: IMPACT family protein [Melioribacteraceae bacterium]|nr:IMPACT family protein [Melioribacteraceae bacterium]
MHEKIITITNTPESEIKEKGSRFLGKAFPVFSKEEAESILIGLRKEFYYATHVCYAYKLLQDDIKYSDDGEPSGTAGIRLLNSINYFELSYILVVSIRYYGGTKLGVGTLGKTYYQSGVETLKQAYISEKELYQKLKIQYEFEHSSIIHNVMNEFNAIEIRQDYSDKPLIYCSVKKKFIEDFRKKIIDLTNGKTDIKLNNSPIYI